MLCIFDFIDLGLSVYLVSVIDSCEIYYAIFVDLLWLESFEYISASSQGSEFCVLPPLGVESSYLR
jgi:hypothetical protein